MGNLGILSRAGYIGLMTIGLSIALQLLDCRSYRTPDKIEDRVEIKDLNVEKDNDWEYEYMRLRMGREE